MLLIYFGLIADRILVQQAFKFIITSYPKKRVETMKHVHYVIHLLSYPITIQQILETEFCYQLDLVYFCKMLMQNALYCDQSHIMY